MLRDGDNRQTEQLCIALFVPLERRSGLRWMFVTKFPVPERNPSPSPRRHGVASLRAWVSRFTSAAIRKVGSVIGQYLEWQVVKRI